MIDIGSDDQILNGINENDGDILNDINGNYDFEDAEYEAFGYDSDREVSEGESYYGGLDDGQDEYFLKPLVEIGGETYDRETVTEIRVKQGVTHIEEYTFAWCTSLKILILPNTIKTIGVAAFKGCACELIGIPPLVTMLRSNTFSYCPFLKSIVIPCSV